jgi:lysophospholipid acyltransferase (LPLAT)-like uncharacterized protein
LTEQKKYIKRFFKKLSRLEFTACFIAKLIRVYVDMVLKTSRVVVDIDPASDIILSSKKPCFITLWHGRILVFPKIMAKYGEFIVLTSAHNDGQYIDKFIASLKFII